MLIEPCVDWNCRQSPIEHLGLEVPEARAAHLVGAALGDHVDDAAHRLPELGFVPAGLHLD
ncbi:MAG: hypothetical protein HYU37_10675 [Acidobacteria bacterium]|nr:hypothetical protein [Acidobacteriota bacterium]